MSDNPLVAAPVIHQEPAGETLPVPTPAQEQAADQVFARAEEHHAAADLIGMVAATQLLHDLAIETFRRVERVPHLKKEESEDAPDDGHDAE
jgi:hypothetical protein